MIDIVDINLKTRQVGHNTKFESLQTYLNISRKLISKYDIQLLKNED